MQANATKKCCFGGHLGVFNFCSCSCCSRRTPRTRCVFANATFTGGRATARSHEYRSRGVVLSCHVRWHMRGGIRVPYHARAPQQREQQSRFRHCEQLLPIEQPPLIHHFLVSGATRGDVRVAFGPHYPTRMPDHERLAQDGAATQLSRSPKLAAVDIHDGDAIALGSAGRRTSSRLLPESSSARPVVP